MTAAVALGCALAAEPPNAVDHAGIIQEWGEASLVRGREIYAAMCVNCHGADGKAASLPIARAFGADELKFGSDPYSMFKTLTEGNGLMGAQTWMTPEERYAVIHYIREEFMRPQRDDFVEVHDGYLEELPTVNVAVQPEDRRRRDFGPALASQLGREIPSVLTIDLGDATTIAYDLHSMDGAGLWSGGYLNLLGTHHYRERGEGVPEPDGDSIEGLQAWRWAHGGTFDYPTQELLPRGPMPRGWFDYHGHYLHGDRVVLAYRIDGREVHEMPSKAPGYGAIEHRFHVASGRELKLCVAELAGGADRASGNLAPGANAFKLGEAGPVAVVARRDGGAIGRFVAAGLEVEGGGSVAQLAADEGGRIILTLRAADGPREVRLVRIAGEGEAEALAFSTYFASLPEARSPLQYIAGGALRWPVELVTSVRRGEEATAGGYVLDTVELPPKENPWNVWFRTTALAFFPDGRMVVSTHGGDIWVVSGVASDAPRWKRFAAGLYEPFGLQVVDGLIYVTCKDRITRLRDLNGDGEADFYESFSADTDVSTFFHAYNFDLQVDGEGNFYYAKAGQYTDYALPGAVIKVSPDGTRREVYCTGFRTPNGMGMMPDGRPTVSDNQGNWMPASKVSLCEPGGFYGYAQTHARPGKWAPDGGRIDPGDVVPPKTFDQPIIWMPQDYDNSSGGQVWVDDPRWGPLSGKLLHTSFGKGWLYYTMVQEVDGIPQAAIVRLRLDASTGIHRARVNPADGQVYATGLNGWNGNGRKGLGQGGIHRFRYTGGGKALTDARVERDGLRLEFDFELAAGAASGAELGIEQWNYRWRPSYGSKQWSVRDPDVPGRDKVEPAAVRVAEDRRALLIEIPDLRPVHQLKLDLDVPTADGGRFTEEVYFTINKVPGKDLADTKTLTAGEAR